jgi:hypothetical protein
VVIGLCVQISKISHHTVGQSDALNLQNLAKFSRPTVTVSEWSHSHWTSP